MDYWLKIKVREVGALMNIWRNVTRSSLEILFWKEAFAKYSELKRAAKNENIGDMGKSAFNIGK